MTVERYESMTTVNVRHHDVPLLVLGKGLPYTHIGVHTVESGTTAGAVAEATRTCLRFLWRCVEDRD